MRYETNHFKSPGFITADVPAEVRAVLESEIDDIEARKIAAVDWQTRLAGVIKEEYQLVRSHRVVENFALELASAYNEAFGTFSDFSYATKNVPLALSSVWVNFQKKYEYNPIHTHSSLMSFVIWVRIPYDLEKERAEFPDQNPASFHAANFFFGYTDALGAIREHTLDLTKDWEWKIAMFPAKMSHGVYPFFTSDETRVSVSGNLTMYTG